MASHQLAIAKASLAAALLRPDPLTVSREEIANFHFLLNSMVLQCTAANVQKCKQWVFSNIVQSSTRLAALGKFMTALTASFTGPGIQSDVASNHEPSAKRKRLHLLYLINDILHYGKYRNNDESICNKLQPSIRSLVGSTASFKLSPKHQRKILDLLHIWEEKKYYTKKYLDELRTAAATAEESGQYFETAALGDGNRGKNVVSKPSNSTPYILPSNHGDSSIPWFDLPAGNLMPHIIPNSTRPINPNKIKPLQLGAGPPDESLVLAVKKLLDDVQTIYGETTDPTEKASWDIDELGQPIILDEITGDILDGEGYYGWSRVFCEKMKRRKTGVQTARDDSRGRDSRSRSRSPGARKRRYSDSGDDSSPERYRSRRRRSYSSSRSPSSPHNSNSRPRSRTRSFSRSPERTGIVPTDNRVSHYEGLPPRPPTSSIPPPPPQSFNPAFPPPPPPPQGMPFNGPNPQIGVWPPPPPPPPPQSNPNVQFNPQYGVWPPPPPPPPPGNLPIQYQSQGGYPPPGPSGWQGNGRGYHNGWNNGPPRGGRTGYRGRGW